jgi:peptidoglycan/LPS O-acetylase OafA/YrhL
VFSLPPPTSKHMSRYDSIDVLRGFASIWVVLSHFLPHWNDHYGSTLILVSNAQGVDAVRLFFVISGFVIFMTLEKCRHLADFAWMRFSRLYPAYLASLVLATGIGWALFGAYFWPGGFLANLTMFDEFLGFPPSDVVYWSLTVELAFYLNVAWIFVLGWHRRPKTMVFVWLIAALIWSFFVPAPKVLERGWLEHLFDLDQAPFFALGIVFYDAVKRGWSRAGAALAVFALAVEGRFHGWKGALIAALIALIIQAAIRGHLRFLVGRATLWLGAISYSLYLIHRNLGYSGLDWLHARGMGPGLAIPLVIAAALAAASLLAYGLEKPALERLRRVYVDSRRRKSE